MEAAMAVMAEREVLEREELALVAGVLPAVVLAPAEHWKLLRLLALLELPVLVVGRPSGTRTASHLQAGWTTAHESHTQPAGDSHSRTRC